MTPATVSTPSDREVLVQRSFDAPVNLLWKAYTEPALMRRWLAGYPGWSMPICEMEVHIGGKYRWQWRNDENSQEFGFSGEFLEVVTHSKIVHTQTFEAGNLGVSMGQEGTIVTVTFSESNGVTNVTTNIRYASKADRDASLSTGMTDGMEANYNLLEKVLASDMATQD